MTVLLVQPAINFERTYPLGLAYLAGFLRRRGHAVGGFDARLDGEARYRRLLARPDLRWVGVSLYSANLEAGLGLARLARRLRPDVKVVLGGPHVTLAPDSLEGEACWDYLVRGDGEVPLAGLVEGAGEGVGVRGRCGQGQGQGQGNNAIYVHHDLDELELADREVFPVARYYGDILKADRRWTAVVASRGCHRRCAYCAAAALSGGSFRTRSVESVLEELARLQRDHHLTGVYLEDDNLLLDRPWLEGLLEALARRNPGLTLELPNGLDPMLLDDELLEAMAAGGVTALAVGIESTIEENQRFLRRPLDRGHLETVLRTCRALGLRTTGYVMVGLPHDRPAALARMFAEVRAMDLDLAHVSRYEPLPSTAPVARRALRAQTAAFYLYFYADPSRLASVVRQGASLASIGRRYAHWLLR